MKILRQKMLENGHCVSRLDQNYDYMDPLTFVANDERVMEAEHTRTRTVAVRYFVAVDENSHRWVFWQSNWSVR